MTTDPARNGVGPVGWLINNRPEQLNAMNALMRDEFEVAWKALDADPEVRVIVHTGEGRAFQTGVDVTELATDGIGMERYRESVENWDLHFTAWHERRWKPVITAVNGICAGGAFHWVADADIVIAAVDAQFFDPHVSVGQVVAIEAIGLMQQDAGRGGDAHGVRRPVRAHAGAAGVRAGHDQRGRRPARAAARGGAGARREDRQELAGRDGRDEARAVGRDGDRPHRRLPGRAPRSWCRCGAIPTRRRVPRAFAEKREARWMEPLAPLHETGD